MKIVALAAAAAAAFLAIPAASAAPASAAAPAVSHTAVTVAYAQHHRRMYWRKVCSTQWRHHKKVRTCRKVKAWR